MKNFTILVTLLLIPIGIYAQVTLISEDFNGTTQPANWHQDNFGSGTQLWTFGNNTMPFGSTSFPTNAAIFNDNAAGNSGNHDLVWLWHDEIDLSNCGVFWIFFDLAIDPVSNDKFMWGVWDNTNYNWIPIKTYEYAFTGVLDCNYFYTNFITYLNQEHPGVDPAHFYLGFGFDDVDSDKTWGVGIDNVRVDVWFFPSNNEPINAVLINCGDSITGNILGSTVTETVEDCDETPENPSTESGVWFKFVGNGAIITLSTCNNETFFDTSLNIYSGTPGNLICEVGDDNNSSCSNYLSKIENFQTNTGNTYYVKLATTDGFPSSDDFKLTMTCETSGITENTIPNFEIYPNPVENIINLKGDKVINQVSLYNILGQKVVEKKLNKSQIQIDVSHLTPGIYTVKVHADNQIGSYHLIKK